MISRQLTIQVGFIKGREHAESPIFVAADEGTANAAMIDIDASFEPFVRECEAVIAWRPGDSVTMTIDLRNGEETRS